MRLFKRRIRVVPPPTPVPGRTSTRPDARWLAGGVARPARDLQQVTDAMGWPVDGGADRGRMLAEALGFTYKTEHDA